MPNECARKCSHTKHNSKTCGKGCTGFKLFGVQIDVASDDDGESSIRKSKSLDNLQTCNNPDNALPEPSGYLSDGLIHQSSKSHQRKKGRPWSEDEHRSFLVGLEKLGKGDWKGIANNFVPSRNSSQVASHAQKYYIRMAATEKKRRRSVFDIPLTSDVNQPSQVVPCNKAAESSQQASNPAAASKNISELKQQFSIPAAPATASEKPPLSPMKRRGIPDFRSMAYMPRVSRFTQGFPTHETVMPWVPIVNFSRQSNANYLTTCATFLPQSLQQQKGSSQAASSTNNDKLNLKIRKLTL